MQIFILPIPAFRELQGVSFTDDDTFKIDLKPSGQQEEQSLSLSRSEAMYIQFHLNELLEKHPR